MGDGAEELFCAPASSSVYGSAAPSSSSSSDTSSSSDSDAFAVAAAAATSEPDAASAGGPPSSANLALALFFPGGGGAGTLPQRAEDDREDRATALALPLPDIASSSRRRRTPESVCARATACEWTGSYGDLLAKHLFHDCKFEKISCPFGCGVRIRRRDTEKHKKSCRELLVACEICGDLVLPEARAQHEDEHAARHARILQLKLKEKEAEAESSTRMINERMEKMEKELQHMAMSYKNGERSLEERMAMILRQNENQERYTSAPQSWTWEVNAEELIQRIHMTTSRTGRRVFLSSCWLRDSSGGWLGELALGVGVGERAMSYEISVWYRSSISGGEQSHQGPTKIRVQCIAGASSRPFDDPWVWPSTRCRSAYCVSTGSIRSEEIPDSFNWTEVTTGDRMGLPLPAPHLMRWANPEPVTFFLEVQNVRKVQEIRPALLDSNYR